MSSDISLGVCPACCNPVIIQQKKTMGYSDKNVVFLVCGHILHLSCFKNARKNGNRCVYSGCDKPMERIIYPNIPWHLASPTPNTELIKRAVKSKWFLDTKFDSSVVPAEWISGWRSAVNTLSDDDLGDITEHFLKRVWLIDANVARFFIWCDTRNVYQSSLPAHRVYNLLTNLEDSLKNLNEAAIGEFCDIHHINRGESDGIWMKKYRERWIDDEIDQLSSRRVCAVKLLREAHFSGYTPQAKTASDSAEKPAEKKRLCEIC